MKTTTLGLIASLFLSVQILNAAIVIKCAPQSNGSYNFSVEGYKFIKDVLKKQHIKGDIKVFWDFGDGTWAANRAGQETVNHRYKNANNYTVTAFFIVHYATEKFAPASCTVKGAKASSSGESETVGSFSIKSSLDDVGRIRPKDYICLVVAMPEQGSVSIDFDPSVFAINDAHGTAGVSVNGNTIQSNGKQNVFVSFTSLTFGVNSAKPEVATIKARWNGKNSNVLNFVKNTAYDPNDIKADIRRLKWSEFNGKTDFPIKYTVRFENKGTAEANHVQIRVKVPDGMTYKEKGSDGTFGLAAYGFGNTNIVGPNIATDYDCPICKDTNQDFRCMRVTEPEGIGKPLIFDFQKIKLAPKAKGKENKGYIKYNLFLNKKLEKKTLESFAEIFFDDNGKGVTTNTSRVRFKLQPRLSLRVGRIVQLPLNKEDEANYEVGLVVSRLRPYGFYFPTEIGISILQEELKDVNTIIKGIPVRLGQQIRHNFLGGFLGLGAGLSANISINMKKENKNTDALVSYTKLLAFLDVNINALKQRPTLGVRLGYPLSEKFQPVNGTKGQFQIYAAYQF